ncbi:LysR substrate-binding domain-containing protein [Litoribacillus peritrichatus]|uniref:LysR substrate-binding domain-containing protein n=2 Tax=Litoribacillus peritrichatus TaxID=718191 RepID=A0ABP7MUA8_9GAMM
MGLENGMDWNALRTFLAIARNGSLAGAARELQVNHSTIFRRLNAFEQQIGNRLFDRLNDGYRLTQAGEDVFVRAEAIANAFDDLERQLAGQDFKPRGVVRITAPDNIAYRFLPEYLADFQAMYPEIQVELMVSNQDFNLTRREADIAIRATPAPPEQLIGKKIAALSWSVFCSPEYKARYGAPKGLDELIGHRLIGASHEMSLLPGFQWLEKTHGEYLVAKCNDLVAMSALSEAGYGLAFLPNDQEKAELLKLFTFEPAQKSHLWLLTHPDARQVARIKLLAGHLVNAFQTDERVRE